MISDLHVIFHFVSKVGKNHGTVSNLPWVGKRLISFVVQKGMILALGLLLVLAARLNGHGQAPSKAQTPGATNYQALVSELLFFPEKYPAGNWTPHDLKFRDVWFKADDGSQLHGWLCKAERERAMIFFAHGNGGNIATRVPWLAYLQSRLHVSVFTFDYCGYGRSEGTPTVDGVVQDGRAALRALRAVSGSDTNVVLMGESLGGAVVVQLAAESPVRGLILQSTFTSLRDIADTHYPLLSSIVPTNALNSGSLMAAIHCPLFQSHGTADAVIPFDNGQKLFALANEPKEFVRIDGAGHNNWMTTEYLRRLDLFITKTATTNR